MILLPLSRYDDYYGLYWDWLKGQARRSNLQDCVPGLFPRGFMPRVDDEAGTLAPAERDATASK